MLDGLLVVGDDKGNLFMLGADGQVIWRHETEGEIASKLVSISPEVVDIYHTDFQSGVVIRLPHITLYHDVEYIQCNV